MGLPTAATCTFTTDHVALDANGKQTINVVIDTGSPLTAGSVAKVETGSGFGAGLCFLPGGVLFGLTLLRWHRTNRVLGALLLAILSVGVMATSGMRQSGRPRDTCRIVSIQHNGDRQHYGCDAIGTHGAHGYEVMHSIWRSRVRRRPSLAAALVLLATLGTGKMRSAGSADRNWTRVPGLWRGGTFSDFDADYGQRSLRGGSAFIDAGFVERVSFEAEARSPHHQSGGGNPPVRPS